jgi:cytochrome P450
MRVVMVQAASLDEPRLVPQTVAPSPNQLPLLQFLRTFIRNPLSSLPAAVYEDGLVVRKFGKGRMGAVWVTDPALLEKILLTEMEQFRKTAIERRVFEGTLGDGILTSQDASWKWQRRTAAPLFRPADLAALVPAMSKEASTQLAQWKSRGPGTVNVDQDMSEMTFRVISQTMFAGSADSDTVRFQQAGEKSLKWVTWELAAGLVGLPTWAWHPGKWPRAAAAKEMRAVVGDLLDRRLAAGIATDTDLLARLALAKDPETGQPMDREQLIDNLLTFLAAGHETTAKALTWTLYLLARAPQWQERIADEVRSVAGAGPIDHSHLEKLIVTRQVLEESMRLYPPAPVMNRVATEDMDLGGHPVTKGTLMVIPVYALHRHRKLWTDPDAFDPTRFAPEAKRAQARAQYMPFGFGPRLCIGMSFAMMEGQALLATLVRGAQFSWDGQTMPEPLSRITLRPRGGMPLGVQLR